MCQLSLTHPPTVHYREEPGCITSIPWSVVGWPWSHPSSQLNKPQSCSLSLQDKGSSPTVLVASPHLPPVYQCHSCIRHPKRRQYPAGWGLAGVKQRGQSLPSPGFQGHVLLTLPQVPLSLFLLPGTVSQSCSLAPSAPACIIARGIYIHIFFELTFSLIRSITGFSLFCRTFATGKLVCQLNV